MARQQRSLPPATGPDRRRHAAFSSSTELVVCASPTPPVRPSRPALIVGADPAPQRLTVAPEILIDLRDRRSRRWPVQRHRVGLARRTTSVSATVGFRGDLTGRAGELEGHGGIGDCVGNHPGLVVNRVLEDV